MGAWLAEDASRVSNLTPHLGPGQGSLCCPPPQPLLPQGAATQGGFWLPRSLDRWGWGQTPQPSCPASPANHLLQVLATPWGSPAPQVSPSLPPLPKKQISREMGSALQLCRWHWRLSRADCSTAVT